MLCKKFSIYVVLVYPCKPSAPTLVLVTRVPNAGQITEPIFFLGRTHGRFHSKPILSTFLPPPPPTLPPFSSPPLNRRQYTSILFLDIFQLMYCTVCGFCFCCLFSYVLCLLLVLVDVHCVVSLGVCLYL